MKYQAKTLIDGYKVGIAGKTLVAVPNIYEGKNLVVLFGGKKMVIDEVGKEALTWRTFDDKFGRKDRTGKIKQYSLIYYEWKPEV